MYKLLIIDMVKNTGRVDNCKQAGILKGRQMRYSSNQAVVIRIGEQYPRGLNKRGNQGTHAMVQAGADRVQMKGKGLIQYTRQKVRNQTTRQHKKTRLKLK